MEVVDVTFDVFVGESQGWFECKPAVDPSSVVSACNAAAFSSSVSVVEALWVCELGLGESDSKWIGDGSISKC